MKTLIKAFLTGLLSGIGILFVLGTFLFGIFLVLPKPPLEVSFRNSLVNSGQVMIITNTSEEPLRDVTVAATSVTKFVRNESSSMKKIVAVALQPRQSIEVGWMETGWIFEPREQFRVSCAWYIKDIEGVVPASK